MKKSKEIIQTAKDRYKELEHKNFDWRSFYNGYLEAVAQSIKNQNIDYILNDCLNKATIGRNRIKQPNSNTISGFVNEYLQKHRLDQAIKKATPNLNKIKDVDKIWKVIALFGIGYMLADLIRYVC